MRWQWYGLGCVYALPELDCVAFRFDTCQRMYRPSFRAVKNRGMALSASLIPGHVTVSRARWR